jgi:hypothetical protein
MSSYQVLVEKAADGFLSATVIGVPECTAEGTAKEEALKSARARLKERLARGELLTIIISLTPGAGSLSKRAV